MKISVNSFKILIKLASLGDSFERKSALHIGSSDYMMNRFYQNGLIKTTSGTCRWELTDKAYREMAEMEKLLEQVQ